jgi:hypothetical protein
MPWQKVVDALKAPVGTELTAKGGDRNLLLGAPGRSSRGPRRDPGGSQRDRPTPASRVPP